MGKVSFTVASLGTMGRVGKSLFSWIYLGQAGEINITVRRKDSLFASQGHVLMVWYEL